MKRKVYVIEVAEKEILFKALVLNLKNGVAFWLCHPVNIISLTSRYAPNKLPFFMFENI